MASNPLLELSSTSGDLARIEEELRLAVVTQSEALTEMAGHLVAAGGKRIRPLLAVGAAACADGADGPASRDVIRGGVAVELVHIGSLHHDDVIDEAVTRRGVESVNARWGNLRAIVSGDFLLARGSEIGASLGTEVAGLLAATISRLCEGEVLELQTAYQIDRTEASYLDSIEGKTASLLSTACRIGALVAELPPENVDRLTEFGTAYGMAFQMVDDLLDLMATDEQLGKPAGHDLIEGVYTLPVIRALAEPDSEELRSLLGGPIEGDAWKRSLKLVRTSPGLESSIESVQTQIDMARAALEPLAHRPAAQALAGAADHLLESISTVRF